MSEDRLPTALWVDACLQPLAGRGIFHYITNKGEHNSGVILLKLSNTKGTCRLLIQQRDLMTSELGWVTALSEEMVEEAEADQYIQRALARDPDLWVIEIEDPEMNNPFEDH